MISKLKQACGYDYTNKLQSMYQDIAVSKDLNEKFRQKDSTSEFLKKIIDFRVKVLSNGSWPLDTGISCTLPQELTKAIELFTAFYNSRYSGRKLMWLTRLSKSEILMIGKKLQNGEEKRYFIKVKLMKH